MKAIIMAGGEGTRLRPLTCDLPKPMVSFFDKPLVQYTVELLKKYGFTDMIFTLMYKPQRIIEAFDNGAAFDVQIAYSVEESPLGTAGSVKHALPSAAEPVLVLSGDALTDIDLSKALAFHRENGAKATLVLKKMENPLEYGIVITDENASIVKFLEKPGWREVFSDAVNTGIYILEPDVLELIPENKNYDFAKNLFPDMLEKGMKLCGYVAEEYWCDVGNIESYVKAHEDVLKGQCRIALKGNNLNGIWIGQNVKISNSALLQAPAYLGDGCVVKDGAKIGMFSALSENTEVGEYSNLKKAVLWPGAKTGKNVKISSAVVCDNAYVGSRSNLYEGAVVGRECVLDGNNTLSPRARIWPAKWLENGAGTGENIIWGYGQKKGLFSVRGISGELNGTLTAEKITAAGCAYAAALPKDAKFAVATDGSGPSESVLEAFAAGLKLSGAKIYDLGALSVPVLRNYMKVAGIEDGAYIRSNAGQRISIDLLGASTVYAGKAKRKKAQTAFDYFDFYRPSKDSLSRTVRIDGADLVYAAGVSRQIRDIKAKPLIAVFANDRKTDRLFISCLKETGMLYAFFEAEPSVRQMENCNADFGIKFHANGESANIYSKSRFFDTYDAYMSLVYLYAVKALRPSELKLPPAITQPVHSIAVQAGITVTECASEEMYLCNGEELNRLLFDPPYFALKLAAYLSAGSMTFDQFAEEIPEAYTAERELSCEWRDIGKAIRMLYESNKDAVALEGIKMQKGKGWGFVLPREDEPKITIKAEGYSEEYAKELCDFYADEIRRFIKT
jgi:mannose-1-phosphate guanylyltransferase/phosphomannomutase